MNIEKKNIIGAEIDDTSYEGLEPPEIPEGYTYVTNEHGCFLVPDVDDAVMDEILGAPLTEEEAAAFVIAEYSADELEFMADAAAAIEDGYEYAAAHYDELSPKDRCLIFGGFDPRGGSSSEDEEEGEY